LGITTVPSTWVPGRERGVIFLGMWVAFRPDREPVDLPLVDRAALHVRDQNRQLRPLRNPHHQVDAVLGFGEPTDWFAVGVGHAPEVDRLSAGAASQLVVPFARGLQDLVGEHSVAVHRDPVPKTERRRRGHEQRQRHGL
jgi:hypothetical protein